MAATEYPTVCITAVVRRFSSTLRERRMTTDITEVKNPACARPPKTHQTAHHCGATSIPAGISTQAAPMTTTVRTDDQRSAARIGTRRGPASPAAWNRLAATPASARVMPRRSTRAVGSHAVTA